MHVNTFVIFRFELNACLPAIAATQCQTTCRKIFLISQNESVFEQVIKFQITFYLNTKQQQQQKAYNFCVIVEIFFS